MKITYLRRKDIDTKKWDICVNTSKNPMVYGISWYLDIMAENWDGLVAGDYEAVLPLVYRVKYRIKYMYRSPLIQQNGLFINRNLADSTILDLLRAIPKSFKIVELNFSLTRPPKSLNLDTKSNYELSLAVSFKEISKNTSSNTRRNIRKVAGKNINIEKSTDAKLFISNKIKLSKNLLSLNIKKKIEQLIIFSQNRKSSELYLAKNSVGEVVAGVFFLKHLTRIYYLLAFSSPKKENNGASFLILNTFLMDNSDNENILDFEGSNIPGVARFFAGWGAVNNPYYSYQKNSNLISLLFTKV